MYSEYHSLRSLSLYSLYTVCSIPTDFCDKDTERLQFRDCDSDGILDPTCQDALGNFGVMSSKDGCVRYWPNAKCDENDGTQFKIYKLLTVKSTLHKICCSFSIRYNAFFKIIFRCIICITWVLLVS